MVTVAASAAATSAPGRRCGLGRCGRSEGPCGCWAGRPESSSYLLIVGLVSFGLILSHPSAAHWARPQPGTANAYPREPGRLRAGIHGVACLRAGDRSLGGGRLARRRTPGRGELSPARGFAGASSGCTPDCSRVSPPRRQAGLAGRIWWPIHKVAVLGPRTGLDAWGAVPAGDSPALLVMYVASGSFVVALASSRYLARSGRDVLDARTRGAAKRRAVR